MTSYMGHGPVTNDWHCKVYTEIALPQRSNIYIVVSISQK